MCNWGYTVHYEIWNLDSGNLYGCFATKGLAIRTAGDLMKAADSYLYALAYNDGEFFEDIAEGDDLYQMFVDLSTSP